VSTGVLPRRTTCFGVASEMGTGYATLRNTFKRITAGCSDTEKLALYSGTAVTCGFTPRSVRGVAAGAEPEVRIHLPPAASQQRTRADPTLLFDSARAGLLAQQVVGNRRRFTNKPISRATNPAS
jgi:hypothetical protein